MGQRTYFLSPDDGQFILLAESDEHMQSPGYDHLGHLSTHGIADAVQALIGARVARY